MESINRGKNTTLSDNPKVPLSRYLGFDIQLMISHCSIYVLRMKMKLKTAKEKKNPRGTNVKTQQTELGKQTSPVDRK